MHQGETLKRIMSEKGITQQMLADKLNVSRNQVNIICKQQLLGKYLNDCIKILKVSPEVFTDQAKSSSEQYLHELVQTQRDLIESLKQTIELLKRKK